MIEGWWGLIRLMADWMGKYSRINNQSEFFMATLSKDSPLQGARGGIGKQVVVKQYKDKTVVTAYPDMSKVVPSAKQLEQRQVMKEATAYALRIIRDPKQKALYAQKLQPGASVYHAAKKEFFEQLKKQKNK